MLSSIAAFIDEVKLTCEYSGRLSSLSAGLAFREAPNQFYLYEKTQPNKYSKVYCKQLAFKRECEYQLILTSWIQTIQTTSQTNAYRNYQFTYRPWSYSSCQKFAVLLTTWLLSSKLLLKLRLLKTTQRSPEITGLASRWFVDGEEIRRSDSSSIDFHAIYVL